MEAVAWHLWNNLWFSGNPYCLLIYDVSLWVMCCWAGHRRDIQQHSGCAWAHSEFAELTWRYAGSDGRERNSTGWMVFWGTCRGCQPVAVDWSFSWLSCSVFWAWWVDWWCPLVVYWCPILRCYSGSLVACTIRHRSFHGGTVCRTTDRTCDHTCDLS